MAETELAVSPAEAEEVPEEEADLEGEVSEGAGGIEVIEGPAVEAAFEDRVSELEDGVNALLEDFVDNGDGIFTHLLNIKAGFAGLRDAQRAWKHITERPDSALEDAAKGR